jgi:hypothetical protein
MTIDLKWLLPVVAPFALLGLARAVWFAAGAEWSQPAFAAFMSLLFGSICGGVTTAILWAEDIRWPLRIGRRHD